MTRILAIALLLFTSSTAVAEAPSPKPIPNARQTFEQVSALIRENYVDPEVGEEMIWSLALQGLVDHLLKTGEQPINDLLDPRELDFLRGGVKGSISGIGVVFENVEDLAIVREVLPGGPASRTRMAANDRILAVDGQETSKLSTGEIAMSIRGAEGTPVELLMQRGSEEWTETITRGRVEVESVQGLMHEGIGYVRLMHFNEDTAERLDGVLADLKKRGAGAMVVDLRGSPGGLFDVSLEVADRFLARGETIVSLRRRDGKEEIHRAKSPDAVTVPIVVVVGRKTASSAEILAAALKENGRATIVGEKTFGKGTVEKIFELDNGYALKLTIARFYSPQGNNWQGKGIDPDFVIPAPEGGEHGKPYSATIALDLTGDPQLKAAFTLLRMR